ncbi:hypothetical protein [Mangrovicella endophytica]|uniref:hypothetical protein n=1 Tax=Mangrovicella endophytica TaxID=2066697 RepID=UPI000C9DEE6E|nr:hypothetical protein [Mangrovicella endophytica]
MMIAVTLFNANILNVTVVVNEAASPSIWIGGTNAALSWQPQTVIGMVQLNLAGPPGPGILAVGPNTLTVTPDGVITPTAIPLDIPGNVQWITAQLYVFYGTLSTAQCVMLNDGQYVTGSLSA